MIVLNPSGQAVDTSGDRWIVDEMVTLNFASGKSDPFRSAMLSAQKAYLRSLIQRKKPTYVRLHKTAIDALLKIESVERLFREKIDLISFLHREWAGKHSGNVAINRLRIIAKWYSWCAGKGFSRFDPDVALVVCSWSHTGSSTGKAVLRLDPRSGPLTEGEAGSTHRSLWSEFRRIQAGEGSTLPLRIVVASLLMAVLGPNPASLRQLEESDLIAPTRPDRPFILMVPKAKKPGMPWRGAFRGRVLSRELGSAVTALIEENGKSAPPGPMDALWGRPLFRRQGQMERLEGTPLADAIHRVPVEFFLTALEKAARKLDLRDRRGERLHLTPRRLRYTVAKRLVARGATPVQLMDLLDHASIRTVMIYYNCGLEMTPHLDKALGPMMRALAALLNGQCGGDPVKLDPALDVLFGTGRKPKQAIAPVRCLTCPKFEARDATALRRLAVVMGADPGRLSGANVDRIRRAQAAARLCDALT